MITQVGLFLFFLTIFNIKFFKNRYWDFKKMISAIVNYINIVKRFLIQVPPNFHVDSMDTVKTIGEIPSRVFIFNNLLFLSNYQIKVSLRVLIVCALACPRSWRDPSSRNLVRNAEKSGLWIVANISHVGNPIISLPINNRDSWAVYSALHQPI